MAVQEEFTVRRTRPTNYVTNFPVMLERLLYPFDNFLTRLIQSTHCWATHAIAMGSTSLTTIELGISAPMTLFFAGYDDLAADCLLVMILIALISQIPKRFLWRDRPFMAGRAACHNVCTTSSFPSRAVICSTVYGWLIIRGLVNIESNKFHTVTDIPLWGRILAYGVFPLVTSFSRVILGVHYPSDTVVGFGTGWGIIGVVKILDNLDHSICGSDITPQKETLKSFIKLFPVGYASFFVGICLVLIYLSMCHPLRFWVKSHSIMGILLPQLLFFTTCHCSRVSNLVLAPRHDHSIYSWGIGLAVSMVFNQVGILFNPRGAKGKSGPLGKSPAPEFVKKAMVGAEEADVKQSLLDVGSSMNTNNNSDSKKNKDTESSGDESEEGSVQSDNLCDVEENDKKVHPALVNPQVYQDQVISVSISKKQMRKHQKKGEWCDDTKPYHLGPAWRSFIGFNIVFVGVYCSLVAYRVF